MFEAGSGVFAVGLLVVGGLLIWLTLSPFETLGWWAGWFGDRIHDDPHPADGPVRAVPTNPRCYMVYFSGVGRASGETMSYRERDFLRRLAGGLPNAVVIDDLFPYAVNNRALTTHPFTARLWRLAQKDKASGVRVAGYLINVRNIMQIMISADRRYGPLFNQGVAEVVMHILLRYRYDPDNPAPVYIIGYSGAGQIALGSALYLKEWLGAPVYVISLGGVFGSDPALLYIDRLYHLVGSRDRVEKVGLMAPGRWSVFASSEWNRAMRHGRVMKIDMGPMGHTGMGGYLDAKSMLADGSRYVDHTVSVIRSIVASNEAAKDCDNCHLTESAAPSILKA
jgi:hypothetical protein